MQPLRFSRTGGWSPPFKTNLKHITGYFVDESNGRLNERAFIAFIRDYLFVKTFEIPDPTARAVITIPQAAA